MLPYFLLLFISTFFPFGIYQNKRVVSTYDHSYIVRKRNKMTIVMFFLGLFILLALRDITVGRDLIEYKKIFERCFYTSFAELPDFRWELGYTIYNKVVSIISDNFRLLLILSAIIVLLPIYKLYSQETKYSFLLIMLFINMPCFLMMFSGLRQAIATSIGILVFMAIEDKKYILSALLILLAISFHVSAFVLILLYPAFFVKIKAKHLLFIAPAMVAILIFRVPILETFISWAPSHYIEYYGQLSQTGAIGTLLLFLIFSVFSFVIWDETVMTKKDFFLRNILLISTIFQFFVPIHGLAQRMSYYFLIFVPVAMIRTVQAPKKSLKSISNVAVVVMSCFFLVYFFYNGLFSTANLLDVFPYKFLWSEQI